MKIKNLFWGLLFICFGVVLFASQLGITMGLSWFGVTLALLLLSIAISSLIKLNFFGVTIPLALILIIFKKEPFFEKLGIADINSWAIIATALFVAMGLSLIFRKHKFINFGSKVNVHTSSSSGDHSDRRRDPDFIESVVNEDEEEFEASTSFGASSKYINSHNLRKAKFHCSFGAMKIFFDNAQLAQEGAEVFMECSFCGVELYVPKSWRIVNNIDTTLGGVDEKNKSYVVDGPILTLSGNVSLGGIEIIYI